MEKPPCHRLWAHTGPVLGWGWEWRGEGCCEQDPREMLLIDLERAVVVMVPWTLGENRGPGNALTLPLVWFLVLPGSSVGLSSETNCAPIHTVTGKDSGQGTGAGNGDGRVGIFHPSALSLPRKEMVMDIQEQTNSRVPTAARPCAFDLI